MTPEEYAYDYLIGNCKTRYPSDLAAQVIFIRSARDDEHRKWIVQEILTQRAKWLDYLTKQQRKWQSKVSSRPHKCRNHDSWAMRESTVRCDLSSYTDFLPYAHAEQLKHGWKPGDFGSYPRKPKKGEHVLHT